MLVYRLDKNGLGPFVRGDFAAPADNYRPNIIQDFGLSVYYEFKQQGWKCACVSVDQLKEWFDEAWESLLGLGYQVIEVDVDWIDCVVGKRQVVYNPAGVKNIREIEERRSLK